MDTKRMEALIAQLNAATESYENNGTEAMSNFEWDSLFKELQTLESKSGIVLPNSPTLNTGAPVTGVRELHEFPALSLAKSQKIEDVKDWIGGRDAWISWKLDGLTLVLTYDNGHLSKMVTRGNGIEGTNVTPIAAAVKNVPQEISFRGHLVVRGEATISYPDFEKVNAELTEHEPYENPRNLAAGTIRMGAFKMDKAHMDEAKSRCVSFTAFTLVYMENAPISWAAQMDFLSQQGFSAVEHAAVTKESVGKVIQEWTVSLKEGNMQTPVDGLVFTYDDTVYAATGSVTGHHATNAGYAFKWADKPVQTTLDHIEWSCAANCISPVAVFDPVSIEGTTVKRASLCNINEMERLGIGADRKTTLQVIKANMIIPKIVKAESNGSSFIAPTHCPTCHAPTEIRVSDSGTKTLHCTNPDCIAKHIRNFGKFVSRKAMDIDGLSESRILMLVNAGIITDFVSIFHLPEHKAAIIGLDGFGKRSYDQITKAVEKSRNITPEKFICSLCIPMIGTDVSKKVIAAYGFDGFCKRLEEGKSFDNIDGIGEEKSTALTHWYSMEKNRKLFQNLLEEVVIQNPADTSGSKCAGITFVITGTIALFANRNEMKAYIESMGGKVSGSVSKNTNYLINNDTDSASSKNKKAKELGVEIIGEDRFKQLFM